MRYAVYADRIFFLHFGMNFLLLILTAKLGSYRAAYKRLAAAAAVGSLFYVAVMLLPLGNAGMVSCVKAVLMAAGNIGMLYAAFAAKGGRKPSAAKSGTRRKAVAGIVSEALALYIASACALGGALAAVSGIGRKQNMRGLSGRGLSGSAGAGEGTGSIRHILLPAVCAAAGIMWLVYKLRLRQKDPLWTVELKEGDKSCRLTAFMDSGNSLCDPVSGHPVCIAQKEVLEQLGLFKKPEKFRVIPYHSIGRQHGLLKAAAVEEMYLQKGGQKLEKVNVLLAASDQALSESGRYQMLLHPALLERTKGANHDIESSDAGKDAV